MKKILAATALATIISLTPSVALAVEDDSQMMQSGAPTTDLQVTSDDGTTMRAQGSDVQPAGTGTTAVESTSAAPDPAVQQFVAGDAQPTADTQPKSGGDMEWLTTAIGFVVGVLTALLLAGVVYWFYRRSQRPTSSAS